MKNEFGKNPARVTYCIDFKGPCLEFVIFGVQLLSLLIDRLLQLVQDLHGLLLVGCWAKTGE